MELAQPVMRDSRKPLAGVRVIVTDAQSRLGLHVIRALGRAGCRVTAVASSDAKAVVGFSSRYATERVRLPPGKYSAALREGMKSLAPRHDVVVPISTLSIALVLDSSDTEIRHYLPTPDALRVALNKTATMRAAEEAGVSIPRTFYGLTPETIAAWADEADGKFPLVVKFADDRRSGAWEPADRYRIVRSASELVREYTRMSQLVTHEYPLVQEYIEGDGYGFFAITNSSGDPFAIFGHRRLREYPISGGPSTLCESYHDEELVEAGTRLLRALKWRGLAMVEFKRDRVSGDYKLMEINPRFWGSLPLAIQCGVNFPAYQVQLALGMPPQVSEKFPVGKKMRYFFTDALAVLQHFRTGDRRTVATQYLRELLDFSIRDGFFDMRDPLPFVAYLWGKVRR